MSPWLFELGMGCIMLGIIASLAYSMVQLWRGK